MQRDLGADPRVGAEVFGLSVENEFGVTRF
jgi:hypothetical protein